jgi:hypothetical protein
MRIIPFFVLAVLLMVSCSKEKFTSEPKITYTSINPNSWSSDNTSINGPLLKFQLTDLEGDFGFQDTSVSYVYVRNVADSLSPFDSIPFPPIDIADKKNLNVEVSVDLGNILPPAHITRPYTDTLYFEVYVRDFANHKSNVIVSGNPLYFITP